MVVHNPGNQGCKTNYSGRMVRLGFLGQNSYFSDLKNEIIHLTQIACSKQTYTQTVVTA